jgi:uncharacterized protein CbrC (UPF0167 family)
VKFKYIENPEVLIGVSKTEVHCSKCGKRKFCFDAEGFYGDHDLENICSSCLQSGALIGENAYSCDPDTAELIKQINDLKPNAGEEEITSEVKQKTQELEQRTPHLVTWQDWQWPCAEGDYCKFIGYGSKPFYQILAGTEDSEKFFGESLHHDFNEDAEYLWNSVLPEKMVKSYADSNDYGTLFYVFKSQYSDKIITVWDCS